MRLFRRARESTGDRWVVVGLGNPGARYQGNRHNAGAMALALLIERAGAKLRSHKSGCLTAEVDIGGQPAVLARPTSYMNESGGPTAALLRWYKAGPDRLVVLHDEIDIPFGEVRVKQGGGTAGHNGLESLVAHLHTKEFVRVRIGVGRPPGRQEPADYVLSDFSPAQRRELPALLEAAADAAERVVEVGADRAMNEINTRT